MRFMVEIYTISNLNSNALKDEFNTVNIVTRREMEREGVRVQRTQSDSFASKQSKMHTFCCMMRRITITDMK